MATVHLALREGHSGATSHAQQRTDGSPHDRVSATSDTRFRSPLLRTLL